MIIVIFVILTSLFLLQLELWLFNYLSVYLFICLLLIDLLLLFISLFLFVTGNPGGAKLASGCGGKETEK